ncbi:MAG TPA: GNAT family N-acetyltransferase [Propionicimonas sp.]|nr:GNAT family N-acetyltransferase [Propionicimonas sp.]
MFEVRRAREDEWPAVGALTAAAYLADGAMAADDPYYNVLRDAASRATQAELWVAVDGDGALLGTVTWCPPGSSYRELAGPQESEFRTLAVAPAGRGQGVGEALVRHCIRLATEAGSQGVVISTAQWMSTAHRLYRRLGFVPAPERDWSPRPDVRLLAMFRPLP